jgi:hypothetical protein
MPERQILIENYFCGKSKVIMISLLAKEMIPCTACFYFILKTIYGDKK